MPSSEDEAKAVLDALRYLWRGTRWRPQSARVVPASVAGLLVDDDDDQRSIAELGTTLGRAVVAAKLHSPELLILMEFYGLNGYPVGLAEGRHALVGSTAASGDSRLLGRTAVATVLQSAVAKVAAELPRAPRSQPHVLHAEADPIGRGWLREPPSVQRRLQDEELLRVLEAGFYAAFDLVDRSDHFPAISAALHRWAWRHLRMAQPVGPAPRIRQEHRSAANAALAVSLWEIVNNRSQLDQALRGAPVIGWVSFIRTTTGGRVATHPTYGPMTSPLNADQFVLLAGEVLEGRAADGRIADLLLDELRAGRHREVFDWDTQQTIVWAIARGFAAAGAWQTIELARWYGESEPLSMTTVSVIAWSAHVASLHRHDRLAWRLASLAERLMVELHQQGRADSVHVRRCTWQVELIRAGCRVREADRWRGDGRHDRAAAALLDSSTHARRAEDAGRHLRRDRGALSRQLSLELRRAEILLVAARLRDAGRSVEDFHDERLRAEALLERIATVLARRPPTVDADDLSTFERRVELQRAALRADRHDSHSDDSPLAP